MKKLAFLAFIAISLCVSTPAFAELDAQAQPITASLVFDQQAAAPGSTVNAAVKFTIPKPWHIYWKNPGDAGLPTKITYNLPAGYVPGEIQWPEHKTFVQPGNITGYGYDSDTELKTAITIPATAKAGEAVPVKADVRWLACSDRCIPGRATIEKDLSIAALPSGKQAPDFALPDENGKIVKLSDFKGKYLVVQWTNANCPFIKRHYEANTINGLVSRWGKKDVAFVAIDSTKSVTSADLKEVAESKHVTYPLLNDAGGEVGKAYGAKSTPHVFILDKSGSIVYQGALDNDPDGDLETGKINYVDQVLSELTAGKPVSVAETKSYGCSVKYKS